jgi:hypothetical protein
MSSNERRIASRKSFSIPIRICPPASEAASVAAGAAVSRNALTGSHATTGPISSGAGTAKPVPVVDMQDGETVNLSERGIYFKTGQKVKIGQAMELYFTLPRELTGRNPESVRCTARVVHVEQQSDERGWTGVGACVERFEPLQRFRNWDN